MVDGCLDSCFRRNDIFFMEAGNMPGLLIRVGNVRGFEFSFSVIPAKAGIQFLLEDLTSKTSKRKPGTK